MTFWDDNATPAGVFNVGDMYDEYTRRQAAFIIEQLDIDSGYVVDLGCGIGRLAGPVAEALPRVGVWGVDTSRAMIRQAVLDLLWSCLFSQQPLRETFTDDSIDGAWCVLTFQHLPDDTVKQHLKDLFEILKPGARLVTQWVTEGEEGPMSYPRRMPTILHWLIEAGFIFPHFATDHAVTDYSDDWVWVTAEKPA